MAKYRSRRGRRAQRWALVAVALVLFFGGVALFAGCRLSRQQPDWWCCIDPDDEATLEAAESVEEALASELHRADRAFESDPEGPARSEPWRFAISSADANAWLNTRLRRWAENQYEQLEWPDQLRQVQVDFKPQLVRLGARVRNEGGEQIFSAELVPQVRDEALWLPARWAYVGRLPVPAGLVLDQASQHIGRITTEGNDSQRILATVLAALAGERPMLDRPVIPLGDGRRVRILELTPRAGRLEVTCQTEAGG